MVQTIKITNAERNLINDLLNLTGDEIYQKYGYKRNETIVHTAKFPNGIEADIKLVICEEESPYTEGILFHNGFELAHTEPDCTYDGEWNFEHNGIEYGCFWFNPECLEFADKKNNSIEIPEKKKNKGDQL